jgi:hypothetical protein
MPIRCGTDGHADQPELAPERREFVLRSDRGAITLCEQKKSIT